MSIIIQELTERDSNIYAACQTLLNCCQQDFPQALQIEYYVSIGGRMIGAFDVDSLKGLLIWLPSFDSAYLAFLAVNPELRRHGLGMKLMEFWLSLMKKNNVLSLSLDVPANQETAINLYRRFGFEQQELLVNYYPFNTILRIDGLKMQKIF